jgi:hypothetical protein
MKAKNTFRLLIYAFSLLLITTTVKSQGTTKTPKGQTVYLENNWDTPSLKTAWEAAAAQWITNNHSDAIRIAPATSNYNCHSYAWNVSEGGSSSNAWLNQTYNGNPNLSKYWTNDGYTSTSTVGDHEKIFYGSTVDHSAITTATSGKVRSKWGVWPRFEHSTAQCPYSTGSLQYYKLVNPSISGSSEAICNSSQRTFSESSFTNISLNYDWSASATLTEVGGDGTSSYTVAGSAQSGSAIVTLTITTPSGATATSNKNVWVGPPATPVIDGNTTLTCNSSLYTISDNSQVTWSVSGPLQIVGTNYGYKCTVKGTGNGYGWITATATNGCGSVMSEISVEVVCGSYLLVTPNPSNGQTVVSIESAQETSVEELSGTTQSISEASVVDETIPWNLEVYNQNQLLKDTRKIKMGRSTTINTSGWPEGIYIVRVNYNGEILTGKLIVK